MPPRGEGARCPVCGKWRAEQHECANAATQYEYLKARMEAFRSAPIDECIEWPFHRVYNGYGRLKLPGSRRNKRNYRVHRLAFAIYYSKQPSKYVLHDCDNPACFNPLHLYEGSQKQNIADCIARGRMPQLAILVAFKAQGKNRFSVEDVRHLLGLRDKGLTYPQIAEAMGVGVHIIWRYITKGGSYAALRQQAMGT